jgi:hypothetical protein
MPWWTSAEEMLLPTDSPAMATCAPPSTAAPRGSGPAADPRRRIDARVVEQCAVGGVQALLGVITQQGARPAKRPALDLSGSPGHVADLAPHASLGRIHVLI